MNEHANKQYLRAGRDIIADLPLSMVLTDPNKPDNPIVYVNRAFETLTGYSSSYAVGRNCRFLQADQSDQDAVQEMARAIKAREATTVTVNNFRASGERFRNRLMIAPVFSDNGDIYAFVGIQSALTEAEQSIVSAARDYDEQLSEMQHRVKNHLQMISSLIRLEGRGERDPGTSMLARRVEALALLYEEFSHPPNAADAQSYDVVSSGAYVSRVASTIGALDGRSGIRLTIDTDTVYMRSEQAGRMGLLISEILSNTFQHAFDGRTEGLVTVRLKQQGGDRVRLTVGDDGVGMGDSKWPKKGNLGAKIVQGLVAQMGAELNVVSTGGGTLVTVDMENPLDTSLTDEGRRVLSDAGGERSGEEQAQPGAMPQPPAREDSAGELPPES